MARHVPATYVRPIVKHHETDRTDMGAIAEAALGPAMRFGTVKSATILGRAVAFRTYTCLVRHRTLFVNALRGHLVELGPVAAAKTDAQLRRLCPVPGIGPVTACAVAAFAPDHDPFDSGATLQRRAGRTLLA